jgi:hypothetical protein
MDTKKAVRKMLGKDKQSKDVEVMGVNAGEYNMFKQLMPDKRADDIVLAVKQRKRQIEPPDMYGKI